MSEKLDELKITTCREILGMWQQKYQHTQTIEALRVDFYEFEQLQDPGRKLITGFAKRALDGKDCEPVNSFEPFIFGWIALNSWASCVTGSGADIPFLTALALDPETNQRFDNLLKENAVRELVMTFWSFWPILRPLPNRQNLSMASARDELIRFELGRRGQKPRCRPDCAGRHHEDGEAIPMDWPHTLAAIYQVRCNLFHGSKSIESDNDKKIVHSAFRVLVLILSMFGL